MALTEKEQLYLTQVGVNPQSRFLTPEQIDAGLKDPAAERLRLAEEDREDDRLETKKLYTSRFKMR